MGSWSTGRVSCATIILSKEAKLRTKNDLSAVQYRLHGLCNVVTSNDGKKDNGLIVNTVTQITNTPKSDCGNDQ